MILRRHAPDLLQGRDPLEGLVDTDHAQGAHPFTDCLVLHYRRGRTLDDEPANRLAHRQRLDYRHPSQVTTVLATIAAAAVIKDRAFGHLDAEPADHFRFRHELLAAIRTNPPNESLGTGHDHRAGNKERLDPHVVESGDRARRV